MDFKTFGEMLASLPLVKWLARYAHPIAWVLALIFALVLVVNVGYYAFGIDRDDIYVTEGIVNTSFVVTKPQVIHRTFKPYDLYISTAGLAAPSSSANVTATASISTSTALAPATRPAPLSGATMITVTSASGVLLLPQQTLVFTFTPGVYESKRIQFSNDLAPVAAVDIDIHTGTGATYSIPISREGQFASFVRRVMVIDSLNIFSIAMPFLLLFLSQLFLLQKGSLEQIERGVDEIRAALRSGDTEKAKEISEQLRRYTLNVEQKRKVDELTSDNLKWHLEFISSTDQVHHEDDGIDKKLKFLVRRSKETQYYNDMLNYEGRLRENLDQVRKYGSSETIRFERSQIIEQINNISLDLLGLPFSDIAQRYYGTRLLRRYFNKRSDDLNEHLTWLLFPTRYKNLTIDILEDIQEYDEKHHVLDLSVRKRLDVECLLLERMMPPRYFKATDAPEYIDVFDLSSIFYPEEQQSIITIFGKRGSGKTSTLRYFEQAVRWPTTFYLFLCLGDKENSLSTLIERIQFMIMEMLLDIFVSHPSAWGGLEFSHGIFMQVIGSYSSMLKSRLIMRTRNFDPNFEDIDRVYQQDFMNRMREALTEETYSRSRKGLVLGEIGDILSDLGYKSIYLSLAEFDETVNIDELVNQLNLYLRQDILLRVAYKNIPTNPHPVSRELLWQPDLIEQVFNAVLRQAGSSNTVSNRFNAYDDVRKQFVQNVSVPGDLKLWARVFDVCYPDQENDILPQQWDEVCANMQQARSMLRPGGTCWTAEDCELAIKLFKEAHA